MRPVTKRRGVLAAAMGSTGGNEFKHYMWDAEESVDPIVKRLSQGAPWEWPVQNKAGGEDRNRPRNLFALEDLKPLGPRYRPLYAPSQALNILTDAAHG